MRLNQPLSAALSNLGQRFANNGFPALRWAVFAGGVIYLLVRLFAPGFFNGINPYLSLIVGLTTTILAWQVQQINLGDRISTRIWSSMFWGMFLLFLNTLSWSISVIFPQSEDISFALGVLGYLFWGLSYLPFIFGLATRLNTLQTRPSYTQVGVILSITFITVLYMVIFVLFPNFQMAGEEEISSVLISLILAIVNVGMVALCLLIFFAYEGNYRLSWLTISIAFGIRALGDIAYMHSSWEGLASNLFEIFMAIADFTYTYWIVTLGLGLYVTLRINRTDAAAPEISLAQENLTNTDILLFTDAENTLITASENLPALAGKTGKQDFVNLPLKTVLGMTDEQYDQFQERMHKQGYVRNQPYEVEIIPGKKQTAWLTGIHLREAFRGYEGMNLVASLACDENGNSLLSDESKSLIESILNSTGSQEKELKKLFKQYLDAHIKLLSLIASQHGGAVIAKTMETLTNEALMRQNIPVRMENQGVLIPANAREQDIAAAAQIIIASSRRYVANAAGTDLVKRETRRLDQRLGRDYRSLIETYELNELFG